MLKKGEKKLVRPEELGSKNEISFALGLVMVQYLLVGGIRAPDDLVWCRYNLKRLCSGTSMVLLDEEIERDKACVMDGRYRLDDKGEGDHSLRERLEESGGDYLIEGVQAGGRMLLGGSPNVDQAAVDKAVKAALDEAEAFSASL